MLSFKVKLVWRDVVTPTSTGEIGIAYDHSLIVSGIGQSCLDEFVRDLCASVRDIVDDYQFPEYVIDGGAVELVTYLSISTVGVPHDLRLADDKAGPHLEPFVDAIHEELHQLYIRRHST